MRVFDGSVERAFDLYKLANGIASDYAMCKKLGLSRSSYSNWKMGRSNTINADMWKRLSPQLSQYLSDDRPVSISGVLAQQVIVDYEKMSDKDDEYVMARLIEEVTILRQKVLDFEKV